MTEAVAYDDVSMGNPALVKPVEKPKKSDKFWKVYCKYGLAKAYKKCLRVSFAGKCYNFARRVGSKIKRTIIKKR